MSAATLRRPAAWPRVARAEAAALLRSRAVPLTLLGVVLLTAGPIFGGDSEWPYSQVRQFAALMFFFPLLHWRGRARRGSLDQAMPIGAWGYEVVRVACGAMAAAFTMALATAVHTWNLTAGFGASGAAGGYTASYPVALTLVGVAYYLFGSAIMLRAPRPGRVLLGLSLVGMAAMLLTGVGPERYGRLTQYAEDGSQTVTYTTSLTLTSALLWLAAGVAAVLLSVWLGRREPAAVARGFRPRASVLPGRPARARVDARSLRTPRSPATAGMIAAQQFAVLGSRMAWPLAMAAVLAAWSAVREMRGGPSFVAGTGPFLFLWFAAFFWPLLVWVDERAGRDWDEARPVDALTRRLLQAVAGLAWLQAALHLVLIGCIGGAVAVGTVSSPADVPGWAWPGLPLCAAALYCLGCLPVLLSRRPVGWSIIGSLLLAQALILSVILLRTDVQNTPMLSPSRVFAPVGFDGGGGWSLAAALLWLPVFAAMMVAAVRRRVRLDRQGLFAA